MIKIAVCDDEQYVLETIEAYISKFSEEEFLEYQLYKFYDGETLVQNDLIFDIAFLDVKMKEMDGIKTGECLKDKNMKTQIVFITNYVDYSMNAHKIHSFGYLIKPVTYPAIAEILSSYRKLMAKANSSDEFIRIKNIDGEEVKLNTGEIMYFNYAGNKKLSVHITDGRVISFYGTLYQVCNKLDQTKFFRPHKGFIINLKYVETTSVKNFGIKDIYMKDGEKIPLSRDKANELKEKIHMYIRL